MDQKNVPQHVAIIMDGNGRWAKGKQLPRIQGHQIGVERRGRTATGVLGIPIDAVAIFLHDIFERVPESPKDGVPVGQAFRQGCEELKTFYLEAATAKPGAAKSHELADWFWGGTAGGRLLLSLHPAALESAEEGIKQVALGQMVPRAQKHLLG